MVMVPLVYEPPHTVQSIEIGAQIRWKDDDSPELSGVVADLGGLPDRPNVKVKEASDGGEDRWIYADTVSYVSNPPSRYAPQDVLPGSRVKYRLTDYRSAHGTVQALGVVGGRVIVIMGEIDDAQAPQQWCYLEQVRSVLRPVTRGRVAGGPVGLDVLEQVLDAQLGKHVATEVLAEVERRVSRTDDADTEK